MKTRAAVAFDAKQPLEIVELGLEEINTAFDLMHEGRSIRSVVVY